MELKINPEFQDKIPPLTDEEFRQLRENIINDGEVYEPICVWNGTIVDGHNRWKVIQEFPEIPYRIKEMVFADKWEAFDWMYRKQLGRRNLTNEQRWTLVGKMQEARKKSRGGNRGTEHDETGKFTASGQNGAMPKRTRDIIAEEVGISPREVDRAVAFTKGLDALAEVSKEAADKVLQGNSGATKETIMGMRKASEDEKKELAEKILDGSIKKKRQEERETNRKLNAIIDESVNAVRGEFKATYTLADAIDELAVIEQEFLSKVRRVFDVRRDIIDGNESVKRTVSLWIFDIEKLKGEI